MEEKPFARKTVVEFYPNPQAIGIHTNWDIKAHPALEMIINTMPGVERHTLLPWGMSRYDFTVFIGRVFDKHEMAGLILAKIDEYFDE